MRADKLSDDKLEKYYNLMIKMSAWVTEPIDVPCKFTHLIFM